MTVNRRSFLKGLAAVPVVAVDTKTVNAEGFGLAPVKTEGGPVKYEWQEYSLGFKIEDEFANSPASEILGRMKGFGRKGLD